MGTNKTEVILSNKQAVVTFDPTAYELTVKLLQGMGYQNLVDEIVKNTVVEEHNES